jgi:HK97 family phage prohead protease
MPDKQIVVERFSTEFQLAAKQPHESGRFKGVASVFGSIVDTSARLGVRTRFVKGAFARTIADWRSAKPDRQRIKILDSHNESSVPIGLPISLAETDEGLEVVASLNETRGGKDWMAMIKHAAQLGRISECEMSIGFDPLNHVVVEDEEDGEVLRQITEARIWELSLTAFGADRRTHLTEAASLKDLLRGHGPLSQAEREAFERERQRGLDQIAKAERALNAPPPWSCVR